MSTFIWTNPKEEDNRGLRVAAVNMQTGMIEHIFDNVISAANALATSNKSGYAKLVGAALNKYHQSVLGYYWKRVV